MRNIYNLLPEQTREAEQTYSLQCGKHVREDGYNAKELYLWYYFD